MHTCDAYSEKTSSFHNFIQFLIDCIQSVFTEHVSICCQIIKITLMPCVNGRTLTQFYCIKTYTGFPADLFPRTYFWGVHFLKLSCFCWISSLVFFRRQTRVCRWCIWSLSPEVDATCSDFDFGTALHIAASNLCLAAVKCLLELGANPAFRVSYTVLARTRICKLKNWVLLKSFQNRHLIYA